MNGFIHAIIRRAQRAGLLTVDSARAALIEADCGCTSRGHVGNLLSGDTAMSLREADVLLDHIGRRRLAELLAGDEGGVVVYRDDEPSDEGDVLRAASTIAREATAYVDQVVASLDSRSAGGTTLTAPELQQHARTLEGLEGRCRHARQLVLRRLSFVRVSA